MYLILNLKIEKIFLENLYNSLLVFFILALTLSFIIFLLSYFLVYQKYDYEKVSVYECGFQPFTDTRGKFDIKFYLVSILFIIFDLEISFLFPWGISLQLMNPIGFLSMFFFLLILTIGFIYEWKKGALDWD